MAQLQIIDDKDDYGFFLLVMSKIINSKRSGPKIQKKKKICSILQICTSFVSNCINGFLKLRSFFWKQKQLVWLRVWLFALLALLFWLCSLELWCEGKRQASDLKHWQETEFVKGLKGHKGLCLVLGAVCLWCLNSRPTPPPPLRCRGPSFCQHQRKVPSYFLR